MKSLTLLTGESYLSGYNIYRVYTQVATALSESGSGRVSDRAVKLEGVVALLKDTFSDIEGDVTAIGEDILEPVGDVTDPPASPDYTSPEYIEAYESVKSTLQDLLFYLMVRLGIRQHIPALPSEDLFSDFKGAFEELLTVIGYTVTPIVVAPGET